MFVACPDQDAANDPEAVGLTFCHDPTLIKSHHVMMTFLVFDLDVLFIPCYSFFLSFFLSFFPPGQFCRLFFRISKTIDRINIKFSVHM